MWGHKSALSFGNIVKCTFVSKNSEEDSKKGKKEKRERKEEKKVKNGRFWFRTGTLRGARVVLGI